MASINVKQSLYDEIVRRLGRGKKTPAEFVNEAVSEKLEREEKGKIR